MSGRAKEIEFFCPTKNACLQAKFCKFLMSTNVVQNEQGGEGQGAIVVNDAAKRRTKVRGVGKTTDFMGGFIGGKLITFPQRSELTNDL